MRLRSSVTAWSRSTISQRFSATTSDQVVSYMKVMCDGTLNVFETCRILGVKRVVYGSSVAVYLGRVAWRGGKKSGEELDEDDAPNPFGFYGMCKLYAENLAALYTRRFRLETVGLRPTSVFGMGRWVRGSYASGLTPVPAATPITWCCPSWPPWASRSRCRPMIRNPTGFMPRMLPKPGIAP